MAMPISITIADRINDATNHLRSNISQALYAYSEVIADLQNQFPNIQTLPDLNARVEVINTMTKQLRNYSLFDPGLTDYANEVDEDIDMLAERFYAWANQRTYTVQEYAELVGKSRSTIYRWLKQGKLIAQKRGRRWDIVGSKG